MTVNYEVVQRVRLGALHLDGGGLGGGDAPAAQIGK